MSRQFGCMKSNAHCGVADNNNIPGSVFKEKSELTHVDLLSIPR